MGGISDLIHNLEEIKEELKKKEAGELEGDELEKRARAVALERGRDKARKDTIRKLRSLRSAQGSPSDGIPNSVCP